MSFDWTKHDRPRDPCPQCDEPLYDQFFGNGGWQPTEIASDRPHSDRRCAERLRKERDAFVAERHELRTALRALADAWKQGGNPWGVPEHLAARALLGQRVSCIGDVLDPPGPNANLGTIALWESSKR